MTWTFKGRAKRLDDEDLPRIGAKIGVGEDEIHALLEVEAAGSGFDAQGRPKMLFEPHIFYRLLGPGRMRDLAVSKGLAYPRWGEKAYLKDSYPRLLAAMEIDEAKAMMAASWGRAQIMGFNHATVGYVTVQGMVSAFMDDEEKHIEAMVAFVLANHIDDDLKAHRWEVVARTYNGEGYAKNKYDEKLAIAYAKWRAIKDTPWSPEKAPAAPPAPPPPSVAPSQEEPPAAPAGSIAAILIAGGLALAAAIGAFIRDLWGAL